MARKQRSTAKRQDSNDVPVSDEIVRAAARLGRVPEPIKFIPGFFESSAHAEWWLGDVLVRATDKTGEILAMLASPLPPADDTIEELKHEIVELHKALWCARFDLHVSGGEVTLDRVRA